jgi:hypothetical protein
MLKQVGKTTKTKTFQNNHKTINIKEAAQSFNRYCVSVIGSPNNENTNIHTTMQYLHTHYPNGFPDINFSLVSKEEMISIINKLKPKNSSGYDGIINILIKLFSQQIRKPLAYIIIE